jgi:hypothetical protein
MANMTPEQPEINTFEQELLPRGRSLLLLCLLIVGFVACCALSLYLPFDRYIQYQQFTDDDLMFRSRWIYERIHFDPTPIDVAILGSSRAEKGLSPSYLEKALTQKLGRPIHVVNFALMMEGRSMQYVIAKELMRNRPETKIILLAAVERDDLDHPAFRYLADAPDVLQSPLIVNRYYMQNAAVLPYRQLNFFTQSLFPAWFNVSHAFRKDYWGTTFDPTYGYRAPSGKFADPSHTMPKDQLEKGSQQVLADQGGVYQPRSRKYLLSNPLEQFYARDIVAMAQQHCIETIFVYLPFYKSPPHDYNESFYKSLGPVLDATQLDVDPTLYMDEMHFNHNGVDRVSPWLSQSLDPYLAPLQSSAPCSK